MSWDTLRDILLVAVPALAILTTAVYVLHCASMEGMRRRPPPRTHPGFTSASRRPRPYPNPRDRPNTSRCPAGDSTPPSRRTSSSTASSSLTGECVVCFEETSFVELRPCCHRNLCEECAKKIKEQYQGICPICRSQIQSIRNI